MTTNFVAFRLCVVLSVHHHACKVAAREVSIDFDVPRSGPICLPADVGTTAVFHWSEAHNLNELTSKQAYDRCSFTGSQVLAGEGRNAGVKVSLPSAGSRYFACSKICGSNGHKVKICVGETSCPCPEGTEVSAASARFSGLWRPLRLGGLLISIASISLLLL
eukprot:TRINITY_DN42447_c0_g1_i1.p1 TRINITY_DN42447_c0_g1~~TRINITY_DN42447_c0_g1_i1.p1  ORF type:complete len:163 (+),score=8.38 TRINITY_DN42447_c0_g1_i1:41-529(+)